MMYNLLADGTPSVPGFKHRAYITLHPDDSGEAKLSEHIIKALKQLGAKDCDGAYLPELRTNLTNFARNNSVLLVVDNVWTQEQADALLISELGPDSRVIVTSRNNTIPGSMVLKVRMAAVP